MASPLSTGWSISRLAPRTGLAPAPTGGPAQVTAQQNPLMAALSQILGIKPTAAAPAFNPNQTFSMGGAPAQMGPLPAPGVDYNALAATASTPAERTADAIATSGENLNVATRVANAAPFSTVGTSSKSGNIALSNSAYRQPALNPLQQALAKAVGLPGVTPSPTIAGTAITPSATSGVPGFSGGSLPTGGLAPGEVPRVSPLASIGSPQVLAATSPSNNVTVPNVTNFNTGAYQQQGIPDWLRNAILNLNNPDNFNPVVPAAPIGGGFDPRVGATMAATEARIAAQQKALAEENKARIARVKADAARDEHAHELQIQRQRSASPTFGGYGTGWTSAF